MENGIVHAEPQQEKRLVYGPVITKDKAKKLGVWTNSVADTLSGHDYPTLNPSFFESLWNKENEQEDKPSVVCLFNRLLDIFMKLFVNEE